MQFLVVFRYASGCLPLYVRSLSTLFSCSDRLGRGAQAAPDTPGRRFFIPKGLRPFGKPPWATTDGGFSKGGRGLLWTQSNAGGRCRRGERPLTLMGIAISKVFPFPQIVPFYRPHLQGDTFKKSESPFPFSESSFAPLFFQEKRMGCGATPHKPPYHFFGLPSMKYAASISAMQSAQARGNISSALPTLAASSGPENPMW